MDAVEKRFGKMDYDLAADYSNAKAPRFYGPLGTPLAHNMDNEGCIGVNSLAQDWGKLQGNLWLNPPYERISLWASKCAGATRLPGRAVYLLVPASIGANWFWEYVWSFAKVYALHPRLTFDGTPVNPKTGKVDPYPKDLMLCKYAPGAMGLERWCWR
jgi:hypothetical protein